MDTKIIFKKNVKSFKMVEVLEVSKFKRIKKKDQIKHEEVAFNLQIQKTVTKTKGRNNRPTWTILTKQQYLIHNSPNSRTAFNYNYHSIARW